MILPVQNLLLPSPLEEWVNELFEKKEVRVYIKRDELIHPILSGNKYRKLKYNLQHAKEAGFSKLLSFGGAYSNHLYAMAGVCKYTDFKVEMIIRGDELTPSSSPTLLFAKECGVQLTFVTRTAYRDKDGLKKKFGQDTFVIPEGGTNKYSLKGTSEVVDELCREMNPTHLCCAMGTGGTTAGFVHASKELPIDIIGIPVMKGGIFLEDDIKSLLEASLINNLQLFDQYHFGGYAKYTPELLQFMDEFEKETEVELEQVYTGKLFFAVKDLISKDYFKRGSTIVIYHSGGLQGKIKKAQPKLSL